MNTLMDRFLLVIEPLSLKSKRQVHYHTVQNFITHINDLKSESEKKESFDMVNKYLDAIVEIQGEIKVSTGYKLYIDYLKPLVGIYSSIGFKRNSPLKFHLIYSTIFDVFIACILGQFPYPITTILVLLYYVLVGKKENNSTKVYSIFY